MPDTLLCNVGLRVELDGHGDRTLLVVQDGTSIRFWADTNSLEELLEGGVVQLSAEDGYCKIEVEAGMVEIVFGITGVDRGSCRFPVDHLAEALAVVRNVSLPDAPAAQVVVVVEPEEP